MEQRQDKAISILIQKSTEGEPWGSHWVIVQRLYNYTILSRKSLCGGSKGTFLIRPRLNSLGKTVSLKVLCGLFIYWHFGPGNSWLWQGGWPMWCRMLTNIHGLYPSDASGQRHLCASCDNQKLSPGIIKCPMGCKIILSWELVV